MAVRDFSVSACLSHPRIKLLLQTVHHCYMSRLMTKPTKWHVRPAKTQINLGIRPVWSESSLSAWRKLGSCASIPDSKFIHFSGYTITYNYMRCNTICNILVATHWTHSEDSGPTERMPRLIWVLAGRTIILLVLSWGGSYIDAQKLLLQHMFLGCNCIDKHFVETKNNVLRFLEHLLYSFVLFFFCHKKLQYKNFNRISVMTSSGEVKWTCFSVNNWMQKTCCTKKISH